jgi:hypothetical protein
MGIDASRLTFYDRVVANLKKHQLIRILLLIVEKGN